MARSPGRRLAAALVIFAATATGLGWTYPEHRDITAEGIRRLDPRRKAALEALWAQAREGQVSRLCAPLIAGDQGKMPVCIDLAAWPAIAADHSCDANQMLETILESKWILDVAAATSRADAAFAAAKRLDQFTNIRTRLDLALERADSLYSSRALANDAHFLVPRKGSDAMEDAVASIQTGAPLNALALYILQHEAALRLAAEYSAGAGSPAERSAQARLILALEALALHFLQDTFAAGHVAGSWGTAAERKGTHDYYNEQGLEATSWKGQTMILFGDGYMHPEDLARGGAVVALSLNHVLNALEPGSSFQAERETISLPPEVLSGSFNICTTEVMPGWSMPKEAFASIQDVVLSIPMPFRGPGAASLPRFRADFGPFIALASGASLLGASGGFEGSQKGRMTGSLDVGARLGVGLEALLVESGDGQLFVQAGILMAAREMSACSDPCTGVPLSAQLIPIVPARTGLAFRLRAHHSGSFRATCSPPRRFSRSRPRRRSRRWASRPPTGA